jgi:hypothetical protein
MKLRTQCYIIFRYAPTVNIFWQQVIVLPEICIYLDKVKQYFTNILKNFNSGLFTSYYFLLRIISTAVNSPIICQPLKL